jgi:hypothetical protein
VSVPANILNTTASIFTSPNIPMSQPFGVQCLQSELMWSVHMHTLVSVMTFEHVDCWVSSEIQLATLPSRHHA